MIYYWGEEPEAGPAIIRDLGTESFRVDTTLAAGTRTWMLVSGKGSVREANGRTSAIPPHNSWNLGALMFPALKIAAALDDPDTAIAYEGTFVIGGHQVHHIRIHKEHGPKAVREDISRLTTEDFFIDATTFNVVLLRDAVHPGDRATENIVHEVEFSEYRSTPGLRYPSVTTERVNGQRTWVMRIDAVEVNVGLGIEDFKLE
jgi:hypothetical protein